jgi:hypothetical protein
MEKLREGSAVDVRNQSGLPTQGTDTHSTGTDTSQAGNRS